MPGRGGAQKVKRKKSKKEPPTTMDKTLLDSIYGRRRKEREILAPLIAPRLPKLKRKLVTPQQQKQQQSSGVAAPSSTAGSAMVVARGLLSARAPAAIHGWSGAVPEGQKTGAASPSAAPSSHTNVGAGKKSAAASTAAAAAAVPKVVAPKGEKVSSAAAGRAPAAASASNDKSTRSKAKEAADDDDDDDFVLRHASAKDRKAAAATPAAAVAKTAEDGEDEAAATSSDDDEDAFEREDPEAPELVSESHHVAELTSTADIKAFLAAAATDETATGRSHLCIVVAYSTWCPRCSKLVPDFMLAVKEFSAVAAKSKVALPVVRFASVDAERVKGAADELEIDELPSVLLFHGADEEDRLESPKPVALRKAVTDFVASYTKK